MHNARTCCDTQTKQAKKVGHKEMLHTKLLYTKQYMRAYRADVCTRVVAQLRDHLVAESGHMPCSRVQSVHATSVSEKLHDTKQYQHKRRREPDQKWRHNLTQHEPLLVNKARDRQPMLLIPKTSCRHVQYVCKERHHALPCMNISTRQQIGG